MNRAERSDIDLATDALAPWEGKSPLGFDSDAFRQFAAELVVLRAGLTNSEDGELDHDIVGRTIAGMENRALAAAEFVVRHADVERQGNAAQRDLDVLKRVAEQRAVTP